MTKDYIEYLNSDAWRMIKKALFLKVGRQCESCGSKKNIQVHHKHYKNLFHESLDDLKVLCELCHKLEHGIIEPKKKVKPSKKGKRSRSKKKVKFVKVNWTSDKFNKKEEPPKVLRRSQIEERKRNLNSENN